MSKQALLIGCDYTGTPDSLSGGGLDDIQHVQKMLINVYGYLPENIITLRDDNTDASKKPTKANILNSFQSIVQTSTKEIWFHYSGHGSQERFSNGKVEDVIVPTDAISSDGSINTNNMINADTIRSYLDQIHSSCRAIFLFDSCHSGTICELPYTYVCNPVNGLVKPVTVSPNTLASSNIYMISGCLDNQISSNIYLSSMKEYVGAFTTFFIMALQKYNYSIDIKNLYSTVCRDLRSNGFKQSPMLSSSNSSSRNFIFMPDTNVARPIPAIIPMPTPAPYVPPVKTASVLPPAPSPSVFKPSNQPLHNNPQLNLANRKRKKQNALAGMQKKRGNAVNPSKLVVYHPTHNNFRALLGPSSMVVRSGRGLLLGKPMPRANSLIREVNTFRAAPAVRDVFSLRRMNTKMPIVFH
jgi:hypothetical protein